MSDLTRVDSDPGQFFCSPLLEVKTSEHPISCHTSSDLLISLIFAHFISFIGNRINSIASSIPPYKEEYFKSISLPFVQFCFPAESEN